MIEIYGEICITEDPNRDLFNRGLLSEIFVTDRELWLNLCNRGP